MAIKSSGQLSLGGDIGPEFGVSAGSTISLRAMSSAAGFTTPDNMSEFYGFSNVQNDWYFQTRQAWLEANNGLTGNLSLGTTMMGWFRIEATTRKNELLFSIGENTTSQRGSIRVFYYGQFNRLVVELRDRNNTRRLRRQYPLHDNPNRAITGITSSATGWQRSQRGNVDSQGFVHLAFTIETNQQSYTGIRTYWNGEELTYSVNNTSSGVRIDNQVTTRHVAVGNWAWNGVTPGNFDGWIDNPAFWNSVVGEASILSMYLQGNIFPPTAVDNIGFGITQPFYAQGFEDGGNLNVQVQNLFNKTQGVFGSTFGYGTYPNGYP